MTVWKIYWYFTSEIAEYGNAKYKMQLKCFDFFQEGGNAEFLVRTEGSSQPNFRWYHNGVLLIGANKPKLMINNSIQSDAGEYYVAVSSDKQTVVSSIVQLNVQALDNLPNSTRQRTSSTN